MVLGNVVEEFEFHGIKGSIYEWHGEFTFVTNIPDNHPFILETKPLTDAAIDLETKTYVESSLPVAEYKGQIKRLTREYNAIVKRQCKEIGIGRRKPTEKQRHDLEHTRQRAREFAERIASVPGWEPQKA